MADGHRKQHQQPEHKNWRPCFRQQIQLNIARGRLSPLSTDERWYDLLVILDDATSEIYYAQLVEEESTLTVIGELMRCKLFSECLRSKGLPG